MIKKIMMIPFAAFLCSSAYAQTSSLDMSKGITVKQMNSILSSKLDANNGASTGLQIKSGNIDSNTTDNANVSGASVKASYASTARSLSSKFNDKLNLKDLGATLDNSSGDKKTIQNIYDSLPNGSTVEVPRDSGWDGSILTPDPNKHITWDFDNAISGMWSPPAGDGDYSISYNGGFSVQRRDLNTKGYGIPASFFYWNADSNYCGAWCSNWQQFSPANFRAISGPTSSGNTSAITASMESYGQSPSGQYDVGLSLSLPKYGQNSTWGLVIDMNDFSAKSPGAFAEWNEWDLWANGQDVKTWDPAYGVPQAGHRSLFFINAHHLTFHGWYASTAVTAPTHNQTDLPVPSVIAITASDNVPYLWYAIQSGTTGTTSPTFPVPTKFTGQLAKGGTLTVKTIVSGKINVGDSITGASPIQPVIITGQLTGDKGGVGTYSVDDTNQYTSDNEPMYSVPRVTDGGVIWQFGEEQNQTVSSGIWFTGGDTFDTILGVDSKNTISNALVDSSIATMETDTNAAVIRMAEGQVVDFSSAGTLATRNLHTLDYDNFTFNYKVKGNKVLTVDDSGSLSINGDLNIHGINNITKDPTTNSSLWVYGAIASQASSDGTNKGGDFFINRYADSSTSSGTGYIDNPFRINRENGLVSINDGANIGGVNISNPNLTTTGSYLNELSNSLYIQPNTGGTYVDQTDANSTLGLAVRMLQKGGYSYPIGNWNGWTNDGNALEIYSNGRIKTFGPLDISNGEFTVDSTKLKTSLNYFDTPTDFYLGSNSTNNFGLELGSLKTAGQTFIDFHTSGTGSDYDTRLISSTTDNVNKLEVVNSSFKAPSYQEDLRTPSSSTATCSTGQFTDDTNYHYVCTATNTWKRIAFSSDTW